MDDDTKVLAAEAMDELGIALEHARAALFAQRFLASAGVPTKNPDIYLWFVKGEFVI